METFPRETEGLDPWYVTGFVEGEGCFTYSRSGGQMGLYFAIKLTDRDRSLLETIQEFFGGVGRIYEVKPRAAPTSRSGRSKPASYYRVSHRAHLQRVVDHFDRYPLRGAKSSSYAVWRRMVDLRCNQFRKDNSAQLEALARELSALSPRSFDSLPPVG